jgi:hypothetical protein
VAKYRAIKSFEFTGKNGVSRVILKGTLIDGRDPNFKGKEQFFEPVELAADRPGLRRSAVEDATAEPNARRSLGRPRGRRERQ